MTKRLLIRALILSFKLLAIAVHQLNTWRPSSASSVHGNRVLWLIASWLVCQRVHWFPVFVWTMHGWFQLCAQYTSTCACMASLAESNKTSALIGWSDCQGGEGIMAHNVLWLYGMNVLGGIYTHIVHSNMALYNIQKAALNSPYLLPTSTCQTYSNMENQREPDRVSRMPSMRE